MAAWPGTLPDLQQFDGLTYAPRDQAIRTEMEVGPTKSRRRFSTGLAGIQIPLVVTGTQLAAFDAWYEVDLAGGSLTFTWRDPSTGSTVTYLFLERPQFTPWKAHATAASRLWRCTMRLERQA